MRQSPNFGRRVQWRGVCVCVWAGWTTYKTGTKNVTVWFNQWIKYLILILTLFWPSCISLKSNSLYWFYYIFILKGKIYIILFLIFVIRTFDYSTYDPRYQVTNIYVKPQCRVVPDDEIKYCFTQNYRDALCFITHANKKRNFLNVSEKSVENGLMLALDNRTTRLVICLKLRDTLMLLLYIKWKLNFPT